MSDLIDTYTAQIVPDTQTTVSNQYFDLNAPFAFPRQGNACTAYINGRDYMKAVADAIRGAQSFIMITGWQLDYDVELDNRGAPGHPGRLSELLAGALQRGVHVRVMLYDSFAGVLDTHDDTSQPRLNGLPPGRGSIEVLLQNPNTGRAGALNMARNQITGAPANTNLFFSHHQKSVIVDGQVAFVGGIDLAYGRWDTNACDVVIDRSLHVINDAYNGQLAARRAMTPAETLLTQSREGRPGFAAPYTTNSNDQGRLLDEATQPRQPWQDVALRVAGPAAFDVFVNFVLRWNSVAGSGSNTFDGRLYADWFERARGPSFLVNPLQRGAGSADVQICRSAASAQLNDELALWDNHHRYVNDDWKTPNARRREIVQAARAAWRTQHQTSIRDAMVACIRSAQACIYIENQFFMSNCGADQNGGACPSSNPIVEELAHAIARAINADRPFHVWLVLPEHPEGRMEEAGTAAQTWWALQGVKRARRSLIHRINASLVGRHMKAWGLKQWPADNAAMQLELASHGMLDAWRRYLTVLNVRNFGHTASHVLTEMIYVHSKLTIVDDAVAIIGSANINDRSLNGNGDTELAAVVVDTAGAAMTDMGGGVRCVTRSFARELRMRLWRKHLGLLVDQPTTGLQAQGAPAGIQIDRPLDPGTVSGIQALAAANRQVYNQVFVHTARDSYGTLMEGRNRGFSVPSVTRGGTRTSVLNPAVTPPLQSAFMDANGRHKIAQAMATLNAGIKGFWVEMPLDWGARQSTSPPPPANSPQSIADAGPPQAQPQEAKV